VAVLVHEQLAERLGVGVDDVEVFFLDERLRLIIDDAQRRPEEQGSMDAGGLHGFRGLLAKDGLEIDLAGLLGDLAGEPALHFVREILDLPRRVALDAQVVLLALVDDLGDDPAQIHSARLIVMAELAKRIDL